jgi:cellulose synthase/poly-beta-1,6-N-acetylglucosamine synthase-like glycosyltransferase
MIIVHIITLLLFIYLCSGVLYLFVLAVAGRFGKLKKYEGHANKARIAVLVPSFKEDGVIINTALQAMVQNYPPSKFSVTVVADCLQPETILSLKRLPITVIEVEFEKSMKARSLHAAFEQLPSNLYDMALILDADNIMSPDCLEKINQAFQEGWKVVQCHRTAKNKNTSVAVLDALSEEINNTIFRRGHRVLGLSCTLIGSGMAFEYNLIKSIFSLPQILDNPGEDREVDIQLLKQGIPVEYIETAYVFDEKVQRKEVFEKQRTRWLATHVDHLKRFLQKDLRAFFRKTMYLNKLFQCTLLPRLLLMLLFGVILLVCLADHFTRYQLLLPSWKWWVALVAIYLFSLFLAIPRSFYNGHTLKALLKIPVLMLSMMKALLRIRKSKAGFLHTPKEFSESTDGLG